MKFSKVKNQTIILSLISILFIFVFQAKAEQTYSLMPWQVGQFVEYQVISFEGEGADNRYRIALVAKERVQGKEYFWLRIDIFSSVKDLRETKLKKNITFLCLLPEVRSCEFENNPAAFFKNGFFPSSAVKLKVQLFDGEFTEVDCREYFSYQSIIEDTPYSLTPDYLGNIDFTRMHVLDRMEQILVPAGSFFCKHFYVKTDISRSYTDEGFDLWQSSAVPLLGVVKVEFSKTLFWEKWSYKYETGQIRSGKEILSRFFTKRVPGRRREDTCIIKLVNYGLVNENKN